MANLNLNRALFPACLPGENVLDETLTTFIHQDKRKCELLTFFHRTSADENLEKFAEISDGRTYFIDDTTAALGLDQAFQGCLTYQPDITVETEKDIVVSMAIVWTIWLGQVARVWIRAFEVRFASLRGQYPSDKVSKCPPFFLAHHKTMFHA